MKQKFFCLILCFLFFTTCFAGCGLGNQQDHGLKPSQPIVLTLWHYYNGPQKERFDQMVDEFNDTVGAEMGIVVDSITHGSINDLIGNVQASANKEIGAEEFPDLFSAYADTAYELAQKGLLADFSQYLTQEELNAYIPTFIEEGHFSDKSGYCLFPVAKSSEQMVLNKTDWQIFADATGADINRLSTWEGLCETAALYYDWTDAQTPEANDGKAFFGVDSVANYAIVGNMQLGNELFWVQDGKVFMQLDKTIMQRVWQNYYVPYVLGHFAAMGRFRSDDLRTGDLICNVGSSSASAYYSTDVTRADGSSYPIELQAFTYPRFEGGEAYAVQQGAGMAIKKSNETYEYAATVFLKWFTQPQRNAQFSVFTGYFPVTDEALEPENIRSALENASIAEGSLTQQVLDVGITTFADYSLYTSKGFSGGYEARSFIENSIKTAAETDRAALLEAVQNGESYESVAAVYTSDEHFDAWFSTVSDGLGEFN